MSTRLRADLWDAAGAILVVLALGFVFRIIIAYLLPGSGFANDLASFQGWAANLAAEGPWGFYERDFFHDYTPGYLYALWLVGIVGAALGGIGDLIKVPPILADLGLGWLAWSMARELGAGRRAAVLAGVIVIVNPVTWFDSVVWGQVDSFGVVFLLLGVRELWRDRPERAAFWTVVAAVIKPQLGILVPIVAAVTIRRALWPIESGAPDARGAGFRTTLRWERETRGWIRIVTTGAVGLATAIVLSIPFKLSIFGLIEQVGVAAGGYPYLSVNAYNLWAFPTVDGYGLVASGTWVADFPLPDGGATLMFGPVPALVVGTGLLLLGLLATCVAVAWRPTPRSILVGVAVLALVFFVLPTRVHERYLFPFFALAAIPAAVSPRWLVAYVAVSAATFANLYVVLTTLYPNNPSISDWLGIGGAIRSPSGVAIVAIVHVLGLGWAATQLSGGAERRLAAAFAGSARRPETAVAAPDSAPPATAALPAGSRPAMGARVPVALGPPDVAGAETHETRPNPRVPRTPGHDGQRPEPRGPTRPPDGAGPSSAPLPPAAPRWSDDGSFVELGPVGWIRQRLARRSLRPDRSRALHGERGGRLDRLDVWLMVVLLISILTLRTWRLGEPYQMHFDEVYHARTATEFLQHWRYGLSHDIYEWTHPHLAKYAIAVGLVAWGNDRIEAESDLGAPVRDALVQVRRDDALRPDGRAGDRLLVATGSELRVWDLQSRIQTGTVAIPGASALAVDATAARVLVGTEDGRIVGVSLNRLDDSRATGAPFPTAEPLAVLDGPIVRLHVTGDGTGVVAQLEGDRLVGVDPLDGRVTGETVMAGIAGFADGGTGPVAATTPGAVADPAAAAATLAELLGGQAADYAPRLVGNAVRSVVAAVPDDLEETVRDAIVDGRLAGIDLQDMSRVAVATAEGVIFVAPSLGVEAARIFLPGGAQGLAYVDVDGPKLYVTTLPPEGPSIAKIHVGGDSAADGPAYDRVFRIPGAGSRVAWNPATQQVHVLGSPPEGSPAVPAFRSGDEGAATIYVIEPHGDATYGDATLPFVPAAWALDAAKAYPSSDREQLMAFSADGAVAAVDVGQHAFAWRLPGVIAGALMAVLLYLLARILFERRSVAVLVGCFTLVDGMLFAQSRIAMNDAYVGLLIVAAYALFAWLWTRARPAGRSFWVVLPAIGVLLGLALAAKWVAAYAIGALGILVLVRSALGRVIVLLGLIGLTWVLGFSSINVPDTSASAAGSLIGGNLTFNLIMIGITLGAVTVAVIRPVAWTIEELRLAVGVPVAAGGLIILAGLAMGSLSTPIAVGGLSATPLEVGFAFVALALLVYAAFRFAGPWGFGPLAPPPAADDPARLLEPASPAPEGWLRPGWLAGVPLLWVGVCLVAIPLGVYVLSYVPWAALGTNRIAEGFPAEHTGQTLATLTEQMYRYHNGLSSAHAASSPWWAWPLDLKPVWFYQESFAGGTAAAIYDPGNLVLWWMAIPAMAFVVWQAIQRRSLGLALIVIAFACQWVAWARIDRAAFQYHYYTSLPFLFLALAYFIAEVWHGASRRTWLLVRVVAAVAVIGPPTAWLLHRPICWFVGVNDVVENSAACPATIPGAELTARALLLGIVVVAGTILLVREVLALEADGGRGSGGRAGPAADGDAARGDRRDRDAGLESDEPTLAAPDVRRAGVRAVGRRSRGVSTGPGPLGSLGPLGRLGVLAFGAGLAVVLVAIVVPDTPLVTFDGLWIEPIAFVVLLAALPIAGVILGARDPRRFVAGFGFAAVAWFAIAYPNISGLPLPATMTNMYQGTLPTYLYWFQFPVSGIDRNLPGPPLTDLWSLFYLGSIVLVSLVLAYSAWVWRLALAEQTAGDRGQEADGGGPGGPDGHGGPGGPGGPRGGSSGGGTHETGIGEAGLAPSGG